MKKNHYLIHPFYPSFYSWNLFLCLFYPYIYHDKYLFLLHNFQKKLSHKYYYHFFFYMNLMKHPQMLLLRFCFSKN